MKFKHFNSTLNTGCLDLRLTATSNHKVMSCVACGFTAPTMLYADCSHVYCETCLLQLDDSGAEQVEALVTCYCLPCGKTATCMQLQVPETFVARLDCVCPSCSISMKIPELKLHLKGCFASARPPAYRGRDEDSKMPELELADSTSFSLVIKPDSTLATLTDEVKDLDDKDDSACVLPAAAGCPAKDLEVHLSKMVGALRNEFLNKLAEHDEEAAILRRQLNETQHQLDRVNGLLTARTSYRLRLKDTRGRAQHFYTNQVTVAGCISIYFAANADLGHDHFRNVAMYIEWVDVEEWKQCKDSLSEMNLYVCSAPGDEKDRAGPFRMDYIPTSAAGEARTGFAFTFRDVFKKVPSHGSEIRVLIEYDSKELQTTKQ